MSRDRVALVVGAVAMVALVVIAMTREKTVVRRTTARCAW
jgi:hypothetical protein